MVSPGKPKIFNLDLNKTLGLTSGLQETQRQRKSLKQCHKEKKKKPDIFRIWDILEDS